ncbi:hypothetical protein JTE90_028464 [Oedothorax gibbosus]|uniref:Uncharacterized protein n=1 Tax=Oedothorax gibbosus TaxID=931172 RepID=A0AAV6VH96_9ARAC|nr:hypothetical protein JTE90_028464 [Oedothorax gibbosus]
MVQVKYIGTLQHPPPLFPTKHPKRYPKIKRPRIRENARTHPIIHNRFRPQCFSEFSFSDRTPTSPPLPFTNRSFRERATVSFHKMALLGAPPLLPSYFLYSYQLRVPQPHKGKMDTQSQ